jgi:hypothetical protein
MNWKTGKKALILLFLASLILAACSTPQSTAQTISIPVYVAGEEKLAQIPVGSNVQQALNAAGVALNSMDRTEPDIFTPLEAGGEVRVIRVTEEFEVRQQVIPFQHKTVRNESLPEENEIYLQRGKNGLEEITYRYVYEDGQAVDEGTPVKRHVMEEPVPEIIMVGIQSPFIPVAVPGELVYLRDGNAWMIEETTANRRAVVTTGDLDGRVLSLSSDGGWLLFTRKSEEEGQINRLWAADIQAEEPNLIDLEVSNVIHFADWVPGSNSKVVFSTVEPRSAAPGWQANNDLNALTFSPNGWVSKWQDKPILEANSGGVYGWWGTTFAWAPDGQNLAFARPDRVGMLNFDEGTLTTLKEIVPMQTGGDWAWVPGISWGANGNVLYIVDHGGSPGVLSPEESQVFDLGAILVETGDTFNLVSQTGMFAYPLVSPPHPQPSGENAYQIAYLQAAFPNQSENSHYQLVLMDRDGSNRQVLFPPDERSGGLAPQKEWGAWSPDLMPESDHYAIAVILQGNLWLVDTQTGTGQQITSDGLTSRVIWN